MDARIFRAALLAATLLVSMGAAYRTPNFIVQTQSPQLAERLGTAAEQFRRELAVQWLGHEMPDWSQPCTMTVHAGPNLGAGGATSFVFDRGQVFGWRMSIQGSPERLLDSVLPHEITHMVFASHFRQPLPRWADEGGATSVEHADELARHRKMLVEFLKTNRGIAFNRMFAMTEYPRDIMPLYAQGYSLADFLIQQGGRRKYVDFLGDGLKTGRWSQAIQRHYGISDTGTLQNTWLAWVRRGSPPLKSPATQPASTGQAVALASTGKRPRPEPNLIYRTGGASPAATPQAKLVPIEKSGPRSGRPQPPSTTPDTLAATVSSPKLLPTDGWHTAGQSPKTTPRQSPVQPQAAEPVRTQAAHLQPIEKARQIIIQWGQR